MSFRDPAGRLVRQGDRILRHVNQAGLPDLEAFLATAAARELARSGMLIETRPVPDARATFEHEPVPFASFPYEWPPEMLHQAGRLTLETARRVLPQGFGLKDATPYNVLFRGPNPVFVDILSFERRDPRDPTWLPYAQFVRTFVLPLLVERHFGLPLGHTLLAARDGLEPEDVYRLCSWAQRLRPPFLTLVTLPTWLAARHDGYDPALYRPRLVSDPERAGYVLGALLRHANRILDRAAPDLKRLSAWSGYAAEDRDASPEFAAKRAFLNDLLDAFPSSRLLDAGCNTGYHAALAAARGARVVAVDSDPVMVGATWRRAASERLDILPLVVDLTRPTPATGWRNAECASFLERAQGGFDTVVMFALIHHMLVTERVPLDQIIDLAALLTSRIAAIEFVPPQDPMFRRLARGRDELFRDLDVAAFEAAARARFEIVRATPVPGTPRTLYLLEKKL